MKEELVDIIFEVLTENYKDKVDLNKDIKDYLKEKTKDELLYLCLVHGYAKKDESIEDELYRLNKKKKDEIIEHLIKNMNTELTWIFQFFNEKRMHDVKRIAECDGYYEFTKGIENDVNIDTIKILKQLGLIFVKKEKDKITVHMPQFIKNKIKSIVKSNIHLDCYNEIIVFSQGIAETYGAIDILDAYDIINSYVDIKIEEYESIIKFVSLIELAPIYYSHEYQCLCSFNIDDEKVEDILNSGISYVVYDRELYEDIANDEYVYNLREYRELRTYLKLFYDLDLEEEEFIKEELVLDYISFVQADEDNAKKNLDSNIDEYFDVDDFEKKEIIGYIDNIKKKMPNWMKGGEIELSGLEGKIGRNEKCPCGSGKKYKNCCGK